MATTALARHRSRIWGRVVASDPFEPSFASLGATMTMSALLNRRRMQPFSSGSGHYGLVSLTFLTNGNERLPGQSETIESPPHSKVKARSARAIRSRILIEQGAPI